MNTRETIQHYT